MPEQRVSLNTIGTSTRLGGRKAGRQASPGGVAVKLGGGGGAAKRSNKSLRPAPTTKKTTAPRRVGGLGSASHGGNPRSTSYNRSSGKNLGARGSGIGKVSMKRGGGIRVSGGVGKAGTQRYSSRGLLGSGRVSIGMGKGSSQGKYSGMRSVHRSGGAGMGRSVGKINLSKKRGGTLTRTMSKSVGVRKSIGVRGSVTVRNVSSRGVSSSRSAISARISSGATVRAAAGFSGSGRGSGKRSHKVW